MNNIVIVEDVFEKGISLAEQFKEIATEHPEYGINVTAFCYFKDFKEEENNYNIYDFDIIEIDLFNFDEVLDEYLYDEDNPTFIIIDFLLENKYQVPYIQKVNIRYAQMKNRLDTNRLWFYTATGVEKEKTLAELVGNDHLLKVTEANSHYTKLQILENDKFMNLIKNNIGVEV